MTMATYRLTCQQCGQQRPHSAIIMTAVADPDGGATGVIVRCRIPCGPKNTARQVAGPAERRRRGLLRARA